MKQIVYFVLLGIMVAKSAQAVEQAKYTVVQTQDSFEVREYEPHILAEVTLEGDFDSVGSRAFRPLFNYISGENQSRQKIAMTAPVVQEAESEKIAMTAPVGQVKSGTSWAVSFMMPASASMDSLPEPKDPNVVLRQVPARHMAVIRYSGFWTEKAYTPKREKLIEWINANNFNAVGEAIWARYNAPFTPWFLRRNEILVPIDKPSLK